MTDVEHLPSKGSRCAGEVEKQTKITIWSLGMYYPSGLTSLSNQNPLSGLSIRAAQEEMPTLPLFLSSLNLGVNTSLASYLIYTTKSLKYARYDIILKVNVWMLTFQYR